MPRTILGLTYQPPLAKTQNPAVNWSGVTATSWPMGIEDMLYAVHSDGGRRMPEASPGSLIPVAEPNPNARSAAYISSGLSRAPTCAMPMLLNELKAKGYKVQGVTDVRKALEDKNLDALSVATPNHWHSLMVIWAAQAGKHCYVEKPASHDIYQGRVAVEAWKKYGVVVQHGTQQRSGSGRAAQMKAIRDGKFGKLKISYGYCCKPRGGIGFKEPGDPPSNLDWNIWRGPACVDQWIRLVVRARLSGYHEHFPTGLAQQ